MCRSRMLAGVSRGRRVAAADLAASRATAEVEPPTTGREAFGASRTRRRPRGVDRRVRAHGWPSLRSVSAVGRQRRDLTRRGEPRSPSPDAIAPSVRSRPHKLSSPSFGGAPPVASPRIRYGGVPPSANWAAWPLSMRSASRLASAGRCRLSSRPRLRSRRVATTARATLPPEPGSHYTHCLSSDPSGLATGSSQPRQMATRRNPRQMAAPAAATAFDCRPASWPPTTTAAPASAATA